MTACICGLTEATFVGEKDDRTVGRCNGCGLIRTLNPPAKYVEFYTEGDRYHAERDGQIPYRKRYEHDKVVGRLRWTKIMAGMRVLDVGCANGAFVALAWEHGAAAEGVEINPNMAAWARERTGCPIHASLDDAVGPYDLVTLHDVIEHFEDPVAVCREIRSLVRVGGRLIVDTPDAEDPRFAELGMEWHHLKPREHLWFFTEESLRRLLGQAGFLVESVDRPIQGKIVAYARRHRGELAGQLGSTYPLGDPAARLA